MKSPNDNSIEYEMSGRKMTYPNSTIHSLFTEQAEIYPNSIALEFEDRQVTYAKLDTMANQMAHFFWMKGLRPGQIVAVSLDRTPELSASLLAILKCGAAYLPLDSKFPKTRLEFMLEDSQSSFLLTSKSLSASLPFHSNTILIDDLLSSLDQCNALPIEVAVSNEALVYIIYTSGSTGKPKGVAVTHKNFVNLIFSIAIKPGINVDDKLLSITTISFDIACLELFLPLLKGATVVFADYETTRDGQLLLKVVQDRGITILQATPTTWQMLLDSGWENHLAIKAFCGGEAMPLNLARELLSRCDSLWNMYGPTETTIYSIIKQIYADDELITIGSPIANTQIYLLNEHGKAAATGKIGEIAIGGDGVAQGYWKHPELTKEKFILNPFSTELNSILYRTGDLGKLLPNGEIQCLGRIDHQVKIRGHRIELGEIEATLNSIPGIKQSAVIVSNYLGNEAKLVAYLKSSAPLLDEKLIINALSKILPEILLPSKYIWVDEFPLTPNGKIDKKSLPTPEYVRPDSAPLLRKPKTLIEKEIAKVWIEELKVPIVGIDDNFFEMGGTSFLTQRVVTILRKSLNEKISVATLYQYPTISSLSEYLAINNKSFKVIDYSKRKDKKSSRDIAIIGMSGRFPGASSIPELWDVLKEGKETISFFKSDEIDASIPESVRNNPLYVGARGIIPTANTFDAAFFGINPKLAEVMDPQQRLFLEIAWEVLEQKGYLPKHYSGRIGVYAGTGTNTYYKKNILPDNEILDQVGYFQAETVNDKDYISTRTAYHLNIKGPAVSVHSACSTSLLAIAQGVQAIRNGQCDIALAGAASITAPIFSGHLYQEGSMLSSDGHCRAFDAAGKGTVFSDGAGVVLLKSLVSAINDGDEIYAIIKGIGITNDGGNKGSFTAPSAEGQAAAISEALFDAKVTPDAISYVETHGTATPIGDPIEIEGLKMAFGKQPKNGYCAIGSIKTNMGHLTAAAGVAGLIKTILAMNNKLLPASLGFDKPNPAIDFENSPFFVNAKLRQWDSDLPLKAGVSSFGVGGTNVHVILEEYPTQKKVSSSSRPLQLLMWSAKSDNSLKGYATELGKFIESKPNVTLADIAYSLNKTRDTFTHRSFLLSSNASAASQELLLNEKNTIKTSELKVAPNEIVFLFPGQGSQFSQMGINLYKSEKVYKDAVNSCADLLFEKLKLDIRDILYPEIVTPETEAKLKDTRFTQPALFVTEYALSQLWLSWGIKPTAFCGHSIGEFVAAHLAGIFNLEEALHLIALRGQLVSELPDGSMLSVRLSENKLIELLPAALSIAAINSNVLCVVAGENEKIKEFSKSLDALEVANKLLFTSHAFHSTMMDPILGTFEAEVKKIQLNKPNVPIVSTVTGTWLKDEEAINPKYWSNHLRNTVRFASSADTLLKLDDIIFLEVGPGQTLTTLAKQQAIGKIIPAFSSLLLFKNQETEYHSVLNTVGELWLRGIDIDWNSFYGQQKRQIVDLPSYVFDRKYCWIDPPSFQIQNSNLNLIANINTNQNSNSDFNENKPIRKTTILSKIAAIVSQTCGIDYPNDAFSESFLELGLDSLTLTQLAIRLKKDFKLPITFRQLNEGFNSPSLLADYLDQNLPKEEYSNGISMQTAFNSIATRSPIANSSVAQTNNQNNAALGLIAQQLQLLGKQIELLQGNNLMQQNDAVQEPIQQSAPLVFTKNTPKDLRTPEEIAEHQKPFGASPRIEKQTNKMSDSQKEFLDELITKYTQKTGASKTYAQKNRSIMADPRVVSGFKPLTKEIIYPLVIEKSSGNRLWDLDGNEYIDALNGFGACLFGHQPDFIKEALHKQVDTGFEVGPQHPLAGEVCELLCEFTNHERAALCNTGSEAVLGAMRIARTVTGRSLIVAFSGSYHGIVDEALVRGSKKMVTFPAASGIMSESVQNMLILDYGTDESLSIISERANEIAAVLVEPVQSRRPEFQPIAFLKNVRQLTSQYDIALIFDEVITGFRMHPGGIQALFNIQADIATYGKVIGGGLSIGAILGKRKYMDALDGGYWQYGDDSIPEVGVTYFAGTFVRHPLALAACKASLMHLKKQGPALQAKLNDMTNRLVSELNTEFEKKDLPMKINHFGSLWRLKFNDDVLYGELLFNLLRQNGIHIWDGFPCFMTEAYNEADLVQLSNTLKNCVNKMVSAGFFSTNKPVSLVSKQSNENASLDFNKPPVDGARLGRDKDGNPAWFIEDSSKKGEYIKMHL